MHRFTTTWAIGAAALLCATALTALTWPGADARTRRASVQVHAQRGSATAERTTTRQRGAGSRATTVTGENGRTTTRTDTRTRDREAGTATHERERTFAVGAARGLEGDVQRTGEGCYTASRTVTGRDGETHTQTGDFKYHHD